MMMLTIGLTGIMASVFLMGLAANSLPRTSTVPNMTIYILTCLSLVVNSALYVLVFPDDPFTKKIVPERVLAAKDKLERKSPWCILWRLVSVHNILCVCLILAAFVHLMVLVNAT
ncbi:hypothetical protein RB195_003913 [Necator americanus]|uniref:DUF4149 domain-containing protein n=1 Tax=Necator americanus TaxID=51031 RepID=A0ABR1DQW1_NECAM